jgi:hypothetical protein
MTAEDYKENIEFNEKKEIINSWLASYYKNHCLTPIAKDNTIIKMFPSLTNQEIKEHLDSIPKYL